MKKITIVLALAATLFATAAHAMSVREFLTTVAAIPRNPAALFRADTRRLLNEVRDGIATVRAEQGAARRAGQRPQNCLPANVAMSSDQLLTYLRSIPDSRRNISVTQALREWAAERYPCPA